MGEDERQALESERREQIVSAAVASWLEHGYDATSVAVIARRADLAKGTVYLYFDSKESILAEVFRRYSIEPDVRESLAAMDSLGAERAIRLLVETIWTVLRARVEIVGLLVREISIRPEHARNFVEKVVLPTNEALADLFERAADRGELDLAGVDSFVAARALVGTLTIFLFTQELFGGASVRPIADDAIVDSISTIFVRGLGARAA